MHPFLEGTLAGEHAAEKILNVGRRQTARFEILLHRRRNDTRAGQRQKRTAVLAHQLLDAAVDGRSVERTAGIEVYGCTVIALITTGVIGTLPCAPCAVVRTPAMASTTSIPSVTRPKTA